MILMIDFVFWNIYSYYNEITFSKLHVRQKEEKYFKKYANMNYIAPVPIQ